MFSAFPRRRLLPTQPGRCVRVLFSPPRHLRTGPSSRRGYHRRPLESSSWGRAASLWRPPTSSATPPDFGGRQVLCPKSWCPAVANRARRFAGQVRRLRARYGVCGPGTAFAGCARRSGGWRPLVAFSSGRSLAAKQSLPKQTERPGTEHDLPGRPRMDFLSLSSLGDGQAVGRTRDRSADTPIAKVNDPRT